jgi:hypothetical protein
MKPNSDSNLVKAEAEGKAVSPVLPEGVKNFLIDIDGTISEDIPTKNLREWSRPNVFRML